MTARIADLDPDQLSEEQKVIYDTIANGPRKGVRGPLAVWLHRPGLARTAQALGQYCRYETSLEPRLSELAILILGRYWSAGYEWAAHKPIALNAGLSEAVVNAIRDGQAPAFDQHDEAAVYAFLTELLRNHKVSPSVFAFAESMLGKDGVVDLTGIAGYYTLISMTINVFEIPVPEGAISEMED
ncbi:carboxymuconolactone decarboxylase family protein [Paraburkholderia xenovorans]